MMQTGPKGSDSLPKDIELINGDFWVGARLWVQSSPRAPSKPFLLQMDVTDPGMRRG